MNTDYVCMQCLDFELQRILPFPTSSCQINVWNGMILWDIGYHVLYLNLCNTQMGKNSRHYIKVDLLCKLFNIKSNDNKKEIHVSMGHIEKLLHIIKNDDEPIIKQSKCRDNSHVLSFDTFFLYLLSVLPCSIIQIFCWATLIFQCPFIGLKQVSTYCPFGYDE